jgi:prevent-host-death family protein
MKVIEIGALEAKTRFSELLEQVRHGQVFEITRRGQPVAMLQPLEKSGRPAPRKSSCSLSGRLKRLRKTVRPGPSVAQLLRESRRLQ